MIRMPRAIGTLALAAALSGCASQQPARPYEPATEASRDTSKAQALTQQAAPLINKDPQRAEKLLREALGADLWHGPAHNNLGVIYLKQGDLYAAATEFEWARKLMPGHPDPRMNLALTMEKAGRTDEALANYESALEVYPEYIPAVQGLTRLQLRAGKVDTRTRSMLQEIALRGETAEWRSWAQAAAMGQGK